MTQRKGLADLFSAMKMLSRSDVELIVLGTPLVPLAFYKGDYPGFVHERVRSHAAVRQLMLACDVLVLPSIVEGRAMVQMEALSCGLPIIVTPNAGAEDLIEQAAHRVSGSHSCAGKAGRNHRMDRGSQRVG